MSEHSFIAHYDDGRREVVRFIPGLFTAISETMASALLRGLEDTRNGVVLSPTLQEKQTLLNRILVETFGLRHLEYQIRQLETDEEMIRTLSRPPGRF
jgi:hypothetical protein